MLTDERLNEIRERESKATVGPWRHDKGHIRAMNGGPIILRTPPVIWMGMEGYQPRQALMDGEFVTHARIDIIDLLECVEKLKKNLKIKRRRNETKR